MASLRSPSPGPASAMPPKGPSIFLGAAVVAVLSTSYLGLINCLCCAGVIIGAMASVWHYTTTHELTIPAGQGAVLGLSAAALGALIATLLNFVLIKIGLRSDLAISEFIISSFGDQMPPEQVDAMREQMEAEVTFATYFFNALIGVVVSVIFGAIGGAIGASVFKKGGAEPDAAPEAY